MKTIWKFTLEPNCTLDMPVGAEILTVQEQYGHPQMWALVDPYADTEEREFNSYGTGQDVPDSPGVHVGSFQSRLNGAFYVFHVFEVPK